MLEFGVRPTRRIGPSLGIVFLLTALFAWSGTAAAAAPEGVVVHEGSFHAGDIAWEADFLGKPYPVLDGTRMRSPKVQTVTSESAARAKARSR